jgi:hypothetical protein
MSSKLLQNLESLTDLFESDDFCDKLEEVPHIRMRARKYVEEFTGADAITFRNTIMPKPILNLKKLRLYLSEMEFLTDIVSTGDAGHNVSALIAFAGSAPSASHMTFLMELWPNVRFIFVDPAPHVFYQDDKINTAKLMQFVYLRPNSVARLAAGRRICIVDNCKRINVEESSAASLKIVDAGSAEIIRWAKSIKYNAALVDTAVSTFIHNPTVRGLVIEDYFNNSIGAIVTAIATKMNLNLYFWSNIKTGAKDIDILYNSAQQYNWLRVMKPVMSMLKFTCPKFKKEDEAEVDTKSEIEPYASEFKAALINNLDFAGDYNRSQFRYFAADKTCLMAFSSATNTNCALYVSGAAIINNSIILYDHVAIEDQFFYYNLLERSYIFHEIIGQDSSMNIGQILPGFDHCGDCCLFHRIFYDYAAKMPSKDRWTNVQIFEKMKELLSALRQTLMPKNAYHGAFNTPYKSFGQLVNMWLTHVILYEIKDTNYNQGNDN